MESDSGKIETWAIVEVFGHTKLAGYARSVALGTAAMIRIDVPEVTYRERDYNNDGAIIERKIAPFTKFYSPASIFSITPTTEEMARKAMQSWHVEPISYFEIRELPSLPPPPLVEADDVEYEESSEED